MVFMYMRLSEKNGTPYYIGKGKGRRWKHNKHEQFKTPSDYSRVIILEAGLTEIGAFALERRYIKWHGRKDIGTGILQNRTDGGDGVSGMIQSEESNRARSIAQLGVPKGPHTEERKKAISIAKKGKKITGRGLENLRKARELKRGTKRPDHSEKMKGAGNPMFGKKREKTRGSTGMKWYNNGILSVVSDTCPPDYVPGRIYKRKK
jgi:hypothetical protein